MLWNDPMRLRSAILLFFALLTLSAAERSTAQAVRIVHATEELRDGRYVAHVMITNMTSTAISDWKMTFELNSHVEHIEHVEWTDSLNVLQRLPHEVFGQGWTNTILPGEVVWFTISGLAYNNSVEIPRNLFFNGSSYPVEVAFAPEQPVAQPSDMVISTWIDSYDYTTYKGYIVVQNPTDLLFPALWDLKFSAPHLIVDMENVIWSRSGNEYQVYGHTHTDGTNAPGQLAFRINFCECKCGNRETTNITVCGSFHRNRRAERRAKSACLNRRCYRTARHHVLQTDIQGCTRHCK